MEVMKWIKMFKSGSLLARNNNFSIFVKKKKKKKKLKIFDDQNVQIWVIFGQNESFLNFQHTKVKPSFFRLRRLGFVQKIRKFQCTVFEKKRSNNFWWKSEKVTFVRSERLLFIEKIRKLQSREIQRDRDEDEFIGRNPTSGLWNRNEEIKSFTPYERFL